ncbi:MAG: cell division protein ZapB [Treponema sp.]|nr:cell division protein ZapB [Treponema sp.]
MISLDQVYLLEQKVESAVAKIQQLQAENDALRNKCAELTNALSAKSEQLTTIETDQNQIESGIRKALDRLNSIENTVLKTVSSMAVNGQAASTTHQAVIQPRIQETNQNTIHNSKTAEVSEDINEADNQTEESYINEAVSPSFATMTQMLDNSTPAQTPDPQDSIPTPQTEEEESNINPIMNPFGQFDDSSNSDDIIQEEIPEEEEDSQEDDLGFDIF